MHRVSCVTAKKKQAGGIGSINIVSFQVQRLLFSNQKRTASCNRDTEQSLHDNVEESIPIKQRRRTIQMVI